MALTALEARYLPKRGPEWIQVSNAELAEWEGYRDSFDPVAISAHLGYPAAQARQDTEWLLREAIAALASSSARPDRRRHHNQPHPKTPTGERQTLPDHVQTAQPLTRTVGAATRQHNRQPVRSPG
jgi:hypothetical protein